MAAPSRWLKDGLSTGAERTQRELSPSHLEDQLITAQTNYVGNAQQCFDKTLKLFGSLSISEG